MSIEAHRRELDSEPPTIDEGYWCSLLSEGEFAHSAQPEHEALDAEVCDDEDDESRYYVHRLIDDGDWDEITRIFDNDELISAQVVGYNRGGLLIEWRSLQGFVPTSQLVDFSTSLNNVARRNALLDQVGQKLDLRVIELDIEKNRLILSQRAAQAKQGERADILTRLESGNIVSGCVTNLCEFGAFIDLGGLEGLIHISELSWGRVGHPNHMLTRGQTITAYVLGVDQDAGRIALSIKRLHPDPWKTVESRYTLGQIVEGVVTNVVDFGAFVCVEDGLEGLIHVSELAEGHFLHPRNVVTEGQVVETRVLAIDGNARRLGLSLRLKQ